MGFTLSSANGNQTSTGPTEVTIEVPAGAAVGALAIMDGPSGTYYSGTVSDTGGNTYVSAGGGSVNPLSSDALYCLNTGASATSVTYTPSTKYAAQYSVILLVWVWMVNGGAAAFGSESHNFQNSPGTGTDAITSGAVNCAAGSVIMGGCRNGSAAGALSVGTGFTLSHNTASIVAESGAFSSSHAATYTTTDGTESPVITEAISFGISSAPSGSSSQFFFGASMLPLAWVIRRRQQRAKERSRALRSWKQDGQSGLLLPEYRHAA